MAMLENVRRSLEGMGSRFGSQPITVTANANDQVQALSPETDAPGAAQQPQQDDSAHWTEQLPEGVDAGWVIALRTKLINAGNISENDISMENLANPEHRKWLNRMLQDFNRQQASTEPISGGEPSEEPPAIEPPEEPSWEPPPRQTVIPSGRLPRGRRTEVPIQTLAPGGWVPAGDGLWWPPYPTTSGPIRRSLARRGTGRTEPAYTLNAEGQEKALEG